MINFNTTPLDNWIKEKTDVSAEELSKSSLIKYQISKIKAIITYAKKNSRFYSKHLENINPDDINTIEDIAKLPFTSKSDIIEDPLGMVCVKYSMIDRIVSLTTSGTTGNKKRIFFTNKDQELTIDFFANGMKTMVNKGDKVLILMPGQTPGSIGDLLKKGLSRIGVEGIIYGPIIDVSDAYNFMLSTKPNCIVGIPIQVYSLLNFGEQFENPEKYDLKSVLLSTDNVPNIISDKITSKWECKVFNHYGMTEMGLGGGVDCQALYGYHLRETDLFFEIIDPLSRLVVEDGTLGEVVFTTLNREAMPLIRYRTGDLSYFKTECCPCGTKLRTMAHIMGRIENTILLPDKKIISLSKFDEILFSFKNILDYDLTLSNDESKQYLNITLKINTNSINLKEVEMAISNIDDIILNKYFKLNLSFIKTHQFNNTGTTKRVIKDLRNI